MRVSIIGAGYVGLVSGACLAEKGHQVICVDIDPSKVEQINSAASPIFEVGLAELLKRNVPDRLVATTDLRHAVQETEISVIAVGTPFDGKVIDLRFIREVAELIGVALRSKSTYHVVAVKSTVVPGTTDDVVLPILVRASGKIAGAEFGLGMNPEFLTEGEAVQDFMNPDRIVLGGIDDRTISILDLLYAEFSNIERIRCNNRTAEMIKYVSNSLLATMISFSNEIGNLCASLGNIDVVEVLRGVHISKYLCTQMPGGEKILPPITSFLGAGCGFGGSCLPKDVKALVAHGESAGASMRLLEAVIKTNEAQPGKVIGLLRKHFPRLEGIRVGILGLSFRPGTDDMRESPAIPIIRSLVQQGAIVQAYDPVARSQAERIFAKEEVRLCHSLEQVIQNVDALVLVTRWDEFNELPKLLSAINAQPVLVDGRRVIDKHSVAKYEGIGL